MNQITYNSAFTESNLQKFSKISKKEDHLARYTQIFAIYLAEENVIFPFNFAPELSRIFGSEWFVFRKLNSFCFLGPFCTICRSFQIFESFGWMESVRYLCRCSLVLVLSLQDSSLNRGREGDNIDHYTCVFLGPSGCYQRAFSKQLSP